MESLQLLANGFGVALQPNNLMFAILGCLLGTLVGVLPGIGPSASIAILMPVSFALDATPAIIMLTAIYYGAQYGGTITSVLVNTPGEAASAATCLDGYAMAKNGRAGAALSISAIGSFFGGSVSIFALVFVAMPLTRAALKFGPPEQFALMLVAMTLVTALTGRSMVRGMISGVLGLLLSMTGVEPGTGYPRFTFGTVELLDGIKIVPLMMGLFGIGEILANADARAAKVFDTSFRSLWVTRKEFSASVWPIVRGTVIGFVVGITPGIGTVTATFLAYITEKKVSRTPEKFGTGMIEGVAAAETSNNSCAQAALIPLFTLGIPGSLSAAVLMGALMMHGLLPGPLLFKEHASFVWAVIASFYIGNVALLVLNLPLIPVWVAVLKIPYGILFTLILLFCLVGAFSVNSSVFDVWVMVFFGVVGYLFKKLDIAMAPAVLTLVLGPMMEQGLRQSLQMSGGDFSIFFTRPLAGILILVAIASVIVPPMRMLRNRNRRNSSLVSDQAAS